MLRVGTEGIPFNEQSWVGIKMAAIMSVVNGRSVLVSRQSAAVENADAAHTDAIAAELANAEVLEVRESAIDIVSASAGFIERGDGDVEDVSVRSDPAITGRPVANAFDGAATLGNSAADFPAVDIPVIGAILDDKGPIQGVIGNGGYTDDGRPQIVGKADPGVLVHVYRGVDLIGRVVADANGDWSFEPLYPLADGRHSLTIVHEYPNGDSSEESAPYVIFVDKVVPELPLITGLVDDEGRITGAIADQAVTDDNTPTINGTAEANATLIVYDKGREIGRTTVGADGNWSFTPEPALADGLHILSYAAVDRAGNASERSATTEFFVDTRPEKVTIFLAEDDQGSIQGDIVNGGVTDDSTPKLIGTATAGGIVKIYEGMVLLGQVTADVDGSWAFTSPVALMDGAHTFHATVSLPAKGESAPGKPFNLTVDTTPPLKPTIDQAWDDVGNVTGVLSSGDDTDDVRPVLSGSAEKNSLLVISDKGIEIGRVLVDSQGKWSFEPVEALSAGWHEFTARAVDAVGNWSVPSDLFELTVFTAPPAAPVIVNIQDDTGWVQGTVVNGTGVSNDQQPVISGTAGAGDRVTLYMNLAGESQSVVVGTTVADAAGRWSLEDRTTHVDGRVRYEATAITAKGELTATSDAYEITFDFIAPAVPTSLVIGSDAVTVGFESANLRPGDLVVLSVEGVIHQHVLTQHELTQSRYTFAVAGADTKHISAGLMDAAGNASNHVVAVADVIDFEDMAPMRAPGRSTLDLGPATIHWTGPYLSMYPKLWPAGIIEKGFKTGEGLVTPSIGMVIWGENYLTLDDGKTSNYFSMTYGELTNAMTVIFMDHKDVVIHAVDAPLTGGTELAEFSTRLPAGLEYSKVLFSTHIGQYVWIDNINFGAFDLHEIAAPEPRVGFNDTAAGISAGELAEVADVEGSDFQQASAATGSFHAVDGDETMQIDLSASGYLNAVPGLAQAIAAAPSLSTADLLAAGADYRVTAGDKSQMLAGTSGAEVTLLAGSGDGAYQGSALAGDNNHGPYTDMENIAELLAEEGSWLDRTALSDHSAYHGHGSSPELLAQQDFRLEAY